MAKPLVAQRPVTRRAMIVVVVALGALASFGFGQVLGHPRPSATPALWPARTNLARVGSAHGALTPTPTRPLARAADKGARAHGSANHKDGEHGKGD